MTTHLFPRALAVLQDCDIEHKCEQVRALRAAWLAGELDCVQDTSDPLMLVTPGRPSRPRLVSPFETARQSLQTHEGRALLIHALAHIEFNAINLALDAIYRFRGLPRDYYDDWLRVAEEEAYHFGLLREHLHSLGFDYGDFPAHNGLWEMALKTAHDPLVRMALVPRVLEARGLDASPALAKKLAACGDARAVEILRIIERDEIAHVRIGTRWYRHLCNERRLDPVATFRQLLEQFNAPRVRPPFHAQARRAAGFMQAELDMLMEVARAKER